MSEFKINPFDMPDENFYPKRISYLKTKFSYEEAKQKTLKRTDILGISNLFAEHTNTEWAWKIEYEGGQIDGE